MTDADLSNLDAAELESRIEAFRERMRPLEVQLAALRTERATREASDCAPALPVSRAMIQTRLSLSEANRSGRRTVSRMAWLIA